MTLCITEIKLSTSSAANCGFNIKPPELTNQKRSIFYIRDMLWYTNPYQATNIFYFYDPNTRESVKIETLLAIFDKYGIPVSQ